MSSHILIRFFTVSVLAAWYGAFIGTINSINGLGIFKILGRWWRREPLLGEDAWVTELQREIADLKRRDK